MMFKKIITLTVIALLAITVISCTNQKEEFIINNEMLEAEMMDDNYRVYYEIFVGGFSDDNNDGMGDINGVINRLDYLNDGDINSGKSLGITGIWLMPIMPSPSYHKYDVVNYKDIDTAYGTMEDFDNLIAKASERNIDIIIDLVLNHTSNYHPWFRNALEAAESNDTDNPYLDYYILVDEEAMIPGRHHHFHGDLYYEGNFSSRMPELNLDNPAVKEEIKSIIQFWLDKGVQGFRLDAAKYPYFEEHDKNVSFWKWFMDEVTAIKEDAYVVGETWDSNATIYTYYEAINNFDFGMSQSNGMVNLTIRQLETVNDYVRYLNIYRDNVTEINPDAILQPFISNHDMDRAAGYLNLDDYSMHMAANLYMLTYGTPFIYYGEEIGMKGSRGLENTDANRRLAMLWGDGDSVEDPFGSTFDPDQQINGSVQDQISDEDSLYNHYKKLIMIRHAHPEIARGTYNPIYFDDYLYFGGFISTYDSSSVGVFHNVSSSELTIDLSDYTTYTFSELRAYIGQDQASLNGQILTIGPMTSVVLK